MFFRTDMAVERRDLYKAANRLEEIDGIECENEQIKEINVTRVKITNKQGEEALKKRMGEYVTIDIKKLNNLSLEKEKEIIDVFSKELSKIINKHIDRSEEILVIGLGNELATPDSLGAKVVQNIEITRHIKLYLPKAINPETRSISGIAPRCSGNNWN